MTAKRKKTEASASKAKAKTNPRNKGVGVIATIIVTIDSAKGATADEILAVLKKAFPDRKAEGMAATVRIQANRNADHKTKDEDGSVRYFGKKA